MNWGRRSVGRFVGLSVGVVVSAQLAGCHYVRRPFLGGSATSEATIGTAAAAATPTARIPRTAARFELVAVDDSTVRFRPQEATWVRAGAVAHVVDPTNRDALVARMRVLQVRNDTAVALVMSQVTRVRPEHVILLSPPTTRWWRDRTFWIGTLSGGVFAAALGAFGLI